MSANRCCGAGNLLELDSADGCLTVSTLKKNQSSVHFKKVKVVDLIEFYLKKQKVTEQRYWASCQRSCSLNQDNRQHVQWNHNSFQECSVSS